MSLVVVRGIEYFKCNLPAGYYLCCQPKHIRSFDGVVACRYSEDSDVG